MRKCLWTCWVWVNQAGCWAQSQPPAGWRSWCWRSVWLFSPSGPRWRCWCSSEGLAGRFYLKVQRQQKRSKEVMEFVKDRGRKTRTMCTFPPKSLLFFSKQLIRERLILPSVNPELELWQLDMQSKQIEWGNVFSPCCFEKIFFCLCSFGRLSMTGLKNVT